jgi:1,4-dihydroxy-2-naphthoyl-CoA synthase
VDAKTTPTQIQLTRRTPAYWRVTFDNPPLNVMGPEMVRQFQTLIETIEADDDVRVVVFDSAVDGFFLNHSDFTGRLEDMTSLPNGPTGLPPWPDFLVRLTRAPVCSIAQIRGRATGNGSEILLSCDMTFASREKAVISQWEVGVGMVAGGGATAPLRSCSVPTTSQRIRLRLGATSIGLSQTPTSTPMSTHWRRGSPGLTSGRLPRPNVWSTRACRRMSNLALAGTPA